MAAGKGSIRETPPVSPARRARTRKGRDKPKLRRLSPDSLVENDTVSLLDILAVRSSLTQTPKAIFHTLTEYFLCTENTAIRPLRGHSKNPIVHAGWHSLTNDSSVVLQVHSSG